MRARGRRSNSRSSREADLIEGTIALAPGSGSPRKNWPVESWIELAHTLVDSGKASRLLLLTGEVEAANGLRDTVEDGLRALPVRHLDHAPLPEVAAALAGCTGFVGNDSGITHLAAGIGIPTVALFGPTDPAVWSPVGERATVLTAPPGEEGGLAKLEVLEVAEALCRAQRMPSE